MTCPDATDGDEIVLVAGCSSGVVLRRTVSNSEERWTVVGKTFVCLSDRDAERYGAFVLARPRWKEPEATPLHRVNSPEYRALIRHHQMLEEWREFTIE